MPHRLPYLLLALQVHVVHRLTKTTQNNKIDIAASISSIHSRGGTNLSGGLFAGISQQQDGTGGTKPAEPAMQSDRGIADEIAPNSTLKRSGSARLDDSNDTIPSQTSPDSTHGGNNSAADADMDQGPVVQCVSAVFCFTDGAPNNGIVDAAAFAYAVKNLLCSGVGPPPKVHMFGFGGNHDAEMLRGIANAGNGTYFFIEHENSINTAFSDALGGLLTTCAQNIELHVAASAGSGAAVAKVHTGLQQRRDGAGMLITLPDLYAEEVKDIIVDFTLSVARGGADESAVEIACATLRYVSTTKGVRAAHTLPILLRRMRQPPRNMHAQPDIAVHRARIDAADCMRLAVKLADAGQAEAAREVRVKTAHLFDPCCLFLLCTPHSPK